MRDALASSGKATIGSGRIGILASRDMTARAEPRPPVTATAQREVSIQKGKPIGRPRPHGERPTRDACHMAWRTTPAAALDDFSRPPAADA